MTRTCVSVRSSWAGRRSSGSRSALAGLSRPGRSGYVAGFTLLEIILSLAIFSGALATLGEIMRLAEQNAGFAREETTAELLASSVMEELLSGSRDLVVTSKQNFDYLMTDPWVYSISSENTNVQEVIRVGVKVELNLEDRLDPPKYEVYRWMLSPQYVTQIEQTVEQIALEADAIAQESEQRMANAQSTTGTGTGGTSGGGQ